MKKTNNSGFTLIELLVAVIILGVVAAIFADKLGWLSGGSTDSITCWDNAGSILIQEPNVYVSDIDDGTFTYFKNDRRHTFSGTCQVTR